MTLAHLPRIIAAAALLLVAACGTDSEAPPASQPGTSNDVPVTTAPAAEPKTVEAAKAAAQKEFDLFAAGDWGGTWDLWTSAGKAAISRDEYIRLHTECQTISGVTFEITNVRLEGADKATVTYKRLIAAGTGTMVYEDGAWRWQPQPDDMKDYAKGVDAVLKERRAAGSCKG